jgi:hypothetical protein
MHKTLLLTLGAGLLAAVTVQVPGAGLAAENGTARGFGFIKPGESSAALNAYKPGKNKGIGDPGIKAIGDPSIKPGKTRGVWNPGDKGDPGIGDPEDMPTWAREAFGNKGGGGGGGGGR